MPWERPASLDGQLQMSTTNHQCMTNEAFRRETVKHLEFGFE